MVLRDEGPHRRMLGPATSHSVSATAASVHDLDEVTKLVRADDGGVHRRRLPGRRQAQGDH